MRGRKEYLRFKSGEPLTFRQAILAQCYACNGAEEGGEDCKGVSCPLYPFMPYNLERRETRALSPERITGMKMARLAPSK